MSATFPMVSLGEVLSRVKEQVSIAPGERYKQVTIKLWGQGVVLRDEVAGTEIVGAKRFVVRPQQFILSRIDARNGAFGIAPEFLDGAAVSNDFPVFAPDAALMLPEFLGWMSKTRRFVDLCRAASEGTTNRVRLKEDRFLEAEIPLPPLSKQRRIVARIEELARKVEEARGLRRQAVEEANSLCRAMIFGTRREVSKTVKMDELVDLKKPDVSVIPQETYQFAGVYSFGRGVFRGDTKIGMEFSYSRLTQLSEGNFVYPKLMAWEGALGVVPMECDALVVSPEFPVFEVNESLVLPETLDAYFRTPSVWPQLSGTSTGTNVRRRRLNPKTFLDYEFPLPSMTVQRQIREVARQLAPLRKLQSETEKELEAMIPSILDRAFAGKL